MVFLQQQVYDKHNRNALNSPAHIRCLGIANPLWLTIGFEHWN